MVDVDGAWSAAGQGLTFIGYQVIRPAALEESLFKQV